jgi:hypothetical protein
MRLGLTLSGYENMVKIERGKRKRVKCLLPSASSIQRTMKYAEEIMTETVPWELVASLKGKKRWLCILHQETDHPPN